MTNEELRIANDLQNKIVGIKNKLDDLKTQLAEAEKKFGELGSKKNNISIDSIRAQVQEKLNEY